MFLEMEIFDFLPAGHDAGPAAETHVLPLRVEGAVVDDADVLGVGGEGGELVAAAVVVMVGHGVGEAADNGFSDVCHKSQ